MAQLNVRDLARVREILGILQRHGFGRMLINAGFGNYMPTSENLEHETHWTIRVREALFELGPTFVKLGQVLSVRPDIIPAKLVQELELLQDRVPPVSFEEIKKVVESELHADIKTHFTSFSEKPIASASIAQVHKATLIDGTVVAVKIQRPDILPKILADLRILFSLAHIAESQLNLPGVYTPVAIVSEFEAALLQELDFFREANNAERFKTTMAGPHPELRIPKVYPEHSSRRVLVLELCDGQPANVLTPEDPRGAVFARHLIKYTFTQVFETGLFHGDPHPGNILVDDAGTVAYIDFGLVGIITAEMQQILASMFMALVFQDADALVMAIVRAGASSDRVDLKPFRDEVEALLARFHNTSLTRLTERSNLMEFMEVITRHNLKMPKEYAVLLRTTSLVFGISHKLLPNVNIVEEVTPLAQQLLTTQFSPERMAAEAGRLILHAQSGLATLPIQVTQLITDLESGRLQIATRSMDDRLQKEIKRLSVAISLTLCALALAITGAILLAPLEISILGIPINLIIGLMSLFTAFTLWVGLVVYIHFGALFGFSELKRRGSVLLRFFISSKV